MSHFLSRLSSPLQHTHIFRRKVERPRHQAGHAKLRPGLALETVWRNRAVAKWLRGGGTPPPSPLLPRASSPRPQHFPWLGLQSPRARTSAPAFLLPVAQPPGEATRGEQAAAQVAEAGSGSSEGSPGPGSGVGVRGKLPCLNLPRVPAFTRLLSSPIQRQAALLEGPVHEKAQALPLSPPSPTRISWESPRELNFPICYTGVSVPALLPSQTLVSWVALGASAGSEPGRVPGASRRPTPGPTPGRPSSLGAHFE